MTSPPPLRIIQLECTNACNYACRHCYADAGSAKPTEIPIDIVKQLVRRFSSLGVQKVVVSGGEPLLYSKLFELLAVLKSTSVEVIVNTNGAFIDTCMAQEFRKLNVDLVIVSLHGYSPETHDWLTQYPGSYYKAIAALNALAEAGVPSGISSTINGRNHQEIHKIVYIALALGVVDLSFFRFLRIGRGERERSGLDIMPDEHRAVFQNIAQLALKLNCKVVFSCEAPYVFWNKKEDFSPCKAGRDVCVLLPNGDVFPCTGLRTAEYVCGNVHKEPLERIWRDASVLQKLRRFQRDVGSEIHGFCKDCQYLAVCRGGCRAFAFASTGNIIASDPGCWLTRQ